MDEALVENAEHDVHRHDRGDDQEHLVGQRGLKGRRGALERGDEADRAGRPRFSACCDGVDRLAERNARRGVERDGGGRELAEMRDQQRPGMLLDVHDRRQRHLPIGRRRRRRQVDHGQSVERSLQRRIDLQDHAVLVRLGVDGRNDALAEGVVERVVDGRRRDAEAGRGGAVDDDVERQSLLAAGRWRRR